MRSEREQMQQVLLNCPNYTDTRMYVQTNTEMTAIRLGRPAHTRQVVHMQKRTFTMQCNDMPFTNYLHMYALKRLTDVCSLHITIDYST